MVPGTSTQRGVVRRSDYRPPDFWIDRVELVFELGRDSTLVRSRLHGRRNEAVNPGRRPLVLDGEELELRHVRLNGAELVIGEFEVEDSHLVVPEVPERFELETEVVLHPHANTRLSGLYLSSGIFCTQCEAEGFRRITYFLDRPDVMARYSVRIEADRRLSVLLSNGNRVESGNLPGGRHFVRYEDPFRKPCYLFALVAGDLRCRRGRFRTRSGRSVELEIWVEPSSLERCDHALRSLQKAMKWDEEVFGLEYDLDVYMIVAVNDFNMGAMENKGLNLFNSKYVLAQPETATDDDYQAIEGVIAHEYFHNWTGNRVTCRDWFQLTLKEGLTVFRDQLFSADMTSASVKRIEDVRKLRTHQFAEDAGPMVHPVRPESYVSIDNFYTATVYEKGAEVVRLFHTLLGADGFRKGLGLYLRRHDGTAVTCDDFRAALADANAVDLTQFERWYSQAGTPLVEARGEHDPQARSYTLTLRQSCPTAPGAAEPFHIPVRVGCLGRDGRDLPLRLAGEPPVRAATSRLLELREREQRFTFVDVPAPPVPSLLRGFSAPVKLRMERAREELAFLMANDSDPFNRWDAGQELARQVLLELVEDCARGRELVLDPRLVEACGRVLDDETLDGSYRSLALTLPDELFLGQQMEVIDPEAVHAARHFAVRELARALHGRWLELYRSLAADEMHLIDRQSIDRRRLKNRALAYLVSLEEPETIALCWSQFEGATGMTDAEAALACLCLVEAPERERALASFHRRWKHDPLVLDKWFRLQALAPLEGTLERVIELTRHPDFTLKNPNRVRSLLAVFSQANPARFHGRDGRAYAFLADKVLEIDALNPQLAARLVSAFNQWKRYDVPRREAMCAQLARVAAHPGLSKDTGEIVARALGRA